MKRIVFILSALAIMLTVTGELSAQQGGERGNRGNGQGQGERQRMSFSERQEQNLKMLTDSLGLTADQITKIKALNKTYETKSDKMREEAAESGDRNAMREKMRSFMDDYNKDVRALLTDKQKVKFDKLQENRQSRRPSEQGERSRGSNGQSSRGNRGN